MVVLRARGVLTCQAQIFKGQGGKCRQKNDMHSKRRSEPSSTDHLPAAFEEEQQPLANADGRKADV